MTTLPTVCCIRIDFRPNWGGRLITFFDPGGLNGLKDLLVRTVGIVGEIGQFHHPAVKVGEPQVDVVHIGMALLELDRDVLHVGPAQLLRHRPPPYLSTIMLRVAAGSLTTSPSSASVMR